MSFLAEEKAWVDACSCIRTGCSWWGERELERQNSEMWLDQL
jgi:hypothetical protein